MSDCAVTTAVIAAEAASLSRDAALDALEELQRVKAAVDATEARVLARIDQLDRAEHPDVRWDRESVSAILRCAPVTAHGRLAAASRLVEELPATLAALELGRISAGHARAVLDTTLPLDAETAGRVERRVLARCESQSVAEFWARCRKTVLAVDPAGAERRHELARGTRRVNRRPEADGMASMTAFLAADDAARIDQRLDTLTDTTFGGGERTREQVKADVFRDLLVGCTPAAGAGRTRPIEVTIAFSTLAGWDDQPGDLDTEPVPASLAKRLANDPQAFWRPVLIDRDGHLEAVGARSYKPGAMLRRLVQLHDRRCQFPGCRRRATRCETDHVLPFDHTNPTAGGLTEFANLHSLCKRHHRLKHEAGWHVIRKDGVTTWRSPQGRRYEKHPEPYLDATESVGDPDPPPY